MRQDVRVRAQEYGEFLMEGRPTVMPATVREDGRPHVPRSGSSWMEKTFSSTRAETRHPARREGGPVRG